ncbi:uncharacterized protein B0H18DRAFT_1210433 [Fomitopsis serialis]|uniref:uncharacterized protein n=1 Tax=Fomitopsis serialis TaxID=139415 RepID=UPI002008C0E2|nr:uncharacterized protein B0H18DRAFT_1210433 [Neoantrodia serialis]KAH9928176.1 hypothetical protein B0H18DRAFT_1210433 [Neoantrodia serialis]
MSVASPTVLPRSALFPTLLPRPPQPHPTPLQKYGRPGRLNSRRNLQQEMEDLSDEEDELDDLETDIRNRGFNFLVPIGRTFTQHEEKNDASVSHDIVETPGPHVSENRRQGGEASSGSEDSEHTEEDDASAMDDENDSEAEEDLDADMEDMDEGNITGETVETNEDIPEISDEESDDEDYETDD